MLARQADIGVSPRLAAAPQGRIRTRQLDDRDIPAVANLLVQGFSRSTCKDWLEIFRRLAERPTVEGLPKYGYLMESEGAPIGAILLISASIQEHNVTSTRCNLSSWYVDPAYRGYGHLFIAGILKNKNVTFINVSPAPHTLPILGVQGYSQYSAGQFLAAPLTRAARWRTTIVPIDDGVRQQAAEHELLLDHARFGCVSLYCGSDGRSYPFVFRRRRLRGFVPCAQLIYCRDTDEFLRFSGPIGRYLARRGMPLVMMDANGPIPGLTGIYVKGMLPKYFKGPAQPRLGDLAYTETALFGI